MENKLIEKKETRWPTLFDNGWMEKFFQSPIDEFFPGTKLMSVPAVNVAENDKESFPKGSCLLFRFLRLHTKGFEARNRMILRKT